MKRFTVRIGEECQYEFEDVEHILSTSNGSLSFKTKDGLFVETTLPFIYEEQPNEEDA